MSVFTTIFLVVPFVLFQSPEQEQCDSVWGSLCPLSGGGVGWGGLFQHLCGFSDHIHTQTRTHTYTHAPLAWLIGHGYPGGFCGS